MVLVSGLCGMCEVIAYMEATTACRGISLTYHTLQCCITYTPWHGAFDLYLKCGTYTYCIIYSTPNLELKKKQGNIHAPD